MSQSPPQNDGNTPDDNLLDYPTESNPAANGGTPTPPLDAANPDTKSRKGVGGPNTHKPGCACRVCKSRRRQAEANIVGDRISSPEQVPQIDAALQVDSKQEMSDLPEPYTRPSKARQHVAAWLKAKMADPKISEKDIAESLGISPYTLRAQLYKARKDGWLKFNDPINEVKYGHIPLIAENIELFLRARDQKVTIEAAKATLWRDYQAKEGTLADTPTTIFALKIEMPEGFDAAKAASTVKGVIVGKPVTIEGDFIDADKVTQD